MLTDPYAWIEKSLHTIHRADWYRSVQTIDGLPGAVIQLDGISVLNFASNDYLGFAGDKRVINAAILATNKLGTGATGSRLLTGHRALHRDLELSIASLKQTEDAIVFSSGYLANIGTITTLVGKRDLILGDQYNHSCLKNGAILSGATVLEYAHCQIPDLREKLEKERKNYRKCLILTDTVFSMDGDLCPLPELIEIAEEYHAMLLIDEAHGTGVFGEHGAGCVEYFNCMGKPLISMGTLSKALGSLGGYVAGTGILIDFLRNRAPSWIYTTGLTPADTGAALEAIKIMEEEPQRRLNLWKNIETLKNLLADIGIKEGVVGKMGTSPIFGIPLKDATEALKVARQLKEKGIFAPAIRPPTVNTSRLRISLMATHQLEHLQTLVEGLSQILL